MAGGLGSRFWPISLADTPKQFIDIMGIGRTMLQSTFDRSARICPKEHIVVVTGEQYAGTVHEQIEELEAWQVIAEPLRRNTAPCIAYAASVIRQKDPEAMLIVTPADLAIFRPECFDADIHQAVAIAQQHKWIITLGAQPTRPDTNYGYIQFHDKCSLPDIDSLHPVVTFTEKPPVEMARSFIVSGEFYWNTGILILSLPTLEAAYRTHLPSLAETFFDPTEPFSKQHVEQIYATCEVISIDRGIMEKANNVHVLSASFGWSDVETWESLYDVSPRDANGNAILGHGIFTYNTHNCLIATPNSGYRTMVLEGLDGYIVAANHDTLLVCRRSNEEMVFRFASDVEFHQIIDNK